MKNQKLLIFIGLVIIFLTTSCSSYFTCKKRDTTIPGQEIEIERLKDNFTFLFDMDSADQDQVLYISQGKGKNFVLFLKALKMNSTKDAISKFRFTLFNAKGSYYEIGKIEEPVEVPTNKGDDSRKMVIKMNLIEGNCNTPFFPKWKDYTIKDPKNYIRRNDLVIHTQGDHKDFKSTIFSPLIGVRGIGEHICQMRFH